MREEESKPAVQPEVSSASTLKPYTKGVHRGTVTGVDNIKMHLNEIG
jgi:hypothetical protein